MKKILKKRAMEKSKKLGRGRISAKSVRQKMDAEWGQECEWLSLGPLFSSCSVVRLDTPLAAAVLYRQGNTGACGEEIWG
jgi:hypothetical protein